MPTNDKIRLGDVIPFAECEMQEMLYLVKYGGEKLLINKDGKVYLKAHQGKTDSNAGPEKGNADANIPDLFAAAAPAESKVEIPEAVFDPAVYQQGEKTVAVYLEAFVARFKKDFLKVVNKMEQTLKSEKPLVQKFLAKDFGGLPAVKAYLIREIFAHTTIDERGLEILLFLTDVIAINEAGMIPSQSPIDQNQQRQILIDFLAFVRRLGEIEEKKQIFEETYQNFIDQEYELLLKEGGAGFYIMTSFGKALKTQKDFLIKDSNRNYLESNFHKVMRTSSEHLVINMLSYLKAAVILRLNSKSTMEQRGKDENERERILWRIIAYPQLVAV